MSEEAQVHAPMGELARYDAVCRAIAEARLVDEILLIHDQARAMAAAARVAKNRDLDAHCVELRMRAARRLDELRKAQKETIALAIGGEQGGRTGIDGLRKNPSNSRPTLASQGVDKNLAHQAPHPRPDGSSDLRAQGRRGEIFGRGRLSPRRARGRDRAGERRAPDVHCARRSGSSLRASATLAPNSPRRSLEVRPVSHLPEANPGLERVSRDTRATSKPAPADPGTSGEVAMTDNSNRKAEIDAFYAGRKAEGRLIDPETAEVWWQYGQVLDPYGILAPDELPKEMRQVGRDGFARRPDGTWVWFGDLPAGVEEKLCAKFKHKLMFPAGLFDDEPRVFGPSDAKA
jgi:hypothetical protein